MSPVDYRTHREKPRMETLCGSFPRICLFRPIPQSRRIFAWKHFERIFTNLLHHNYLSHL